MKEQLQTHAIAEFVKKTSFEDIPADITEQLKRHLLDSIGSFIYAVNHPSVEKLINQVKELSAGGPCKTPVAGNITVDKAAGLYTALIRFPDFMDNFLAKESTCHPCDNIGALLAASQLLGRNGKDFLTAMALGYQIECRMIEQTPVMTKGFDHTALLSYSLSTALSKLFGLSEQETAHALGIAGCSINPLVTGRASYTFEWKGFASALVALECMNIIYMAKNGITGPIQIFDLEHKGFKEIFGMELKYDWSKENFELIRKCILKSYNSEVHTQPAVEAALELKNEHQLMAGDIEQVIVTTFLTAYHIVGGGEYGERYQVYTKEQADHSLPYVMAASLLDGQLYPEQFLVERINSDDVQQLLKKVKVQTSSPLHRPVKLAGLLDKYTEAYPDKTMTKVEIKLTGGKKVQKEKEDYKGFFTRAFTWDDTIEKFKKMSGKNAKKKLQTQVIEIIEDLENRNIGELMDLLATIR
ncbi:MAG: 2-methylcitrate dehydratase [Chitinophagaceae bacterium]|nr:2-methylcitrate dehydratase [Chitinophagaceae bacterium]